MKEYYLDNAATTRVYDFVLDAMMPYLEDNYGNASTAYDLGQKSKQALMDARKTIADTINADPCEIFFTSGGTEANNWALIKTAESMENIGKHIITSAIEHHSILNTCKYLEDRGWEVTYIGVDENGIIDTQEIEDAIREDTVLVSIMTINNEIGTIQPIHEIGHICDQHGVLFHTDAVQAYGKWRIDVQKDMIDMMSVSGHKFNAPKGIGFLYVNKDMEIKPYMHGGGQEGGLRAGTENVASIVGMATAAKHHNDLLVNWENDVNLYGKLIYFYDAIRSNIKDVKLNGDYVFRCANNLNLCIKGVRSEQLMMILNDFGIYVSAGSACTTGSGEPSHVLKAIGLNDEEAGSSIRITFDDTLEKKDIDFIVKVMARAVDNLRGMKDVS